MPPSHIFMSNKVGLKIHGQIFLVFILQIQVLPTTEDSVMAGELVK